MSNSLKEIPWDENPINKSFESIKAITADLKAHAKDISANRPDFEKKYRDELKIFTNTLKEIGYSTREIADICNVSQPSVVSWINNPDFNVDLIDDENLTELSDRTKDRFSRTLRINAARSFSKAMTEDKMNSASHLQLVTAGGIMLDKARLLDGESTDNINFMYKKKEKLAENIIDVEHEIAALERDINSSTE